jgi:lysozyme
MSNASYDPRLIPFTGQHEGKVLRAYRCPAGAITIGFGFTWGSKIFRDWWLTNKGSKLKLGDTIAEADAFYLLKALIDAEYYGPVSKHAGHATPHAQAAATDMLFNCGLGAAKWTWFKALVRNDVKDAARRLKVTATTAKGRRLPGLIRRRAEAATIMEFNKWPAWVKEPRTSTPKEMKAVMPSWLLGPDDFQQGVEWLVKLGYLAAGSANDRPLIAAATRRFQEVHPQLDNDGVLGRANARSAAARDRPQGQIRQGSRRRRCGCCYRCRRPGNGCHRVWRSHPLWQPCCSGHRRGPGSPGGTATSWRSHFWQVARR